MESEDGPWISHQPSPSFKASSGPLDSGKPPQVGSGMVKVMFEAAPGSASISNDPASSNPANRLPLHIIEYPNTAENLTSRPRKGHKKSRQGCFNCKSRKVKCQETQPRCGNCLRNKLKCTYPAPKPLSAVQQSPVYAPTPVPSITLLPTPTKFTSTELRLFNHYLQEAYPHLPVGADSCWTSLVPLIAHHNEYVMHAILGLAASHLGLLTGENLTATAVHHRQLAILGSNKAISQIQRTGSDGDALLASCYLIGFQSSYMSDGMEETFRMLRGCQIIKHHLKLQNLPMGFFCVDNHDFLFERLSVVPLIDPGLVEDARQALAALQPVVDGSRYMKFYNHLVEMADLLSSSSVKTYFKFINVYEWIITTDSDTLREFTAPKNLVARILLIHFLAMQIIMAPIIDQELGERRRSVNIRSHPDWINSGTLILPVEMRHLIEWPISVAHSARL